MNINFRTWQSMLFMLSLFLLLTSFYFQYRLKLEPCALCIMQRLCVFIITLLALLSRWTRIVVMVNRSQLVVASAGLYFSLRQVWLQSLTTEKLPACLPGFDTLIHYFPWRDIIHALIWGSHDCGQIDWQWQGLSMPAWVAIYFFGVFVLTIYWMRKNNFKC